MKLLTIANRYYLFAFLGVFAVGSLLAFFILRSIINHEFNEKLFAEREQLIYELHTYDDLKETYYLNIGDKIEVEEVAEDPQLAGHLRDTVMYDQYEHREMPYRILTFSDQINDRPYVIHIYKSLVPNQDLIQGVSEIMFGMALLLTVSLGLLNRIIFKKLWAPFHQIVSQLRTFNITQPLPVQTETSNVDEFRELKEVLDRMIEKSIRDYKNLKEYTENTSHEIQTPLAIIKNKAEALLQEPLEERVLLEVGAVYEAAGRLSRLKEGLSILTKIENHQYVVDEPVDLKAFLEKKLESLSELVSMRQLTLKTSYEASPVLQINSDLAYMLLSNLLANAIKHNVDGGEIRLQLEANRLQIENTGNEPQVPVDQLFDRFRRANAKNTDGNGLGLSLVKRIADFYGFNIQYTYSQGWHRLTLSF